MKKLHAKLVAWMLGIVMVLSCGTTALADTTINVNTGNSPYSAGGSGDFIVGDESNANNTGEISGGDYTEQSLIRVRSNGKISGGSFFDVNNDGTITGGKFDKLVSNNGLISGGTFNYELHNNSSGVISDGTINCFNVQNMGTVTGGKFTRHFRNIGTVTGGVFENVYVTTSFTAGTSTITNGSFSGGSINVDTGSMTIKGGTFKDGITIADSSLITINGGTFIGITIPANVTIANADGCTLIFEGCTFADESVLNGINYLTERPVASSSTGSSSASGETTSSASTSDESASGVTPSVLAVSVETSFIGANGETYRRLTAAGSPNIYVQGNEAYLPAGGHFSYIPALDGTDAYNIASGIVDSRLGNVSNFCVVDMDLSDAANNVLHELNGNVYVTMPIPAGLTITGKTLTVYRVDGPNTLTRCNTTVDGDSLTFTTNHFSTYVVVEQDGITSPKTGER